jgi:hypothetical protein
MMDGQVDLRYVRDNLGHTSISITSQYPHADDDDRLRAAAVRATTVSVRSPSSGRTTCGRHPAQANQSTESRYLTGLA